MEGVGLECTNVLDVGICGFVLVVFVVRAPDYEPGCERVRSMSPRRNSEYVDMGDGRGGAFC